MRSQLEAEEEKCMSYWRIRSQRFEVECLLNELMGCDSVFRRRHGEDGFSLKKKRGAEGVLIGSD
jgi:hypothetical protein